MKRVRICTFSGAMEMLLDGGWGGWIAWNGGGYACGRCKVSRWAIYLGVMSISD
jgi:hypothetical protein